MINLDPLDDLITVIKRRLLISMEHIISGFVPKLRLCVCDASPILYKKQLIPIRKLLSWFIKQYIQISLNTWISCQCLKIIFEIPFYKKNFIKTCYYFCDNNWSCQIFKLSSIWKIFKHCLTFVNCGLRKKV